jgi:membrane protein
VKSYTQNFAQCDCDSPWKYGLSDWRAVIKRTWKEAHHDNVSVIAAGVAFFSLLAVFPLITAALSTVSYFADPSDVRGITSAFATLLPGDAYDILDSQINSVLSAPPINASFGIILSLGFAFVSAGAGIRAMMRAMNVAYEEVESRNPALFFIFGLLMTLGSLIFVWVSLFIIIGVSAALSHTDFQYSASFTTRTLPWILLVMIFCYACGIMYRFGPSRRPARKRWLFPGIAFALFSWLAISFGFSKFVTHFGAYNETFGGLASVVILLIWLWLTAMVVILGAELNSELERQTIADTTRGPCRPLGERGATMADFIARETDLEIVKKLEMEKFEGERDTARE